MILLLCGKNTFARQEAYDAVRATHDADGALATNTLTLSGARVTLAELEAAVMTVPFLADYRLVRVDGLCARLGGRGASRGASRAGKRGPAGWDGLPDVLAAVPDTTLLVFIEGELPASNSVRRQIAEVGDVRDFPPPKDRELAPWVHDRARALGLQLVPAAERQLVAQVGSDLWALASELEKLQLYAGDATIDETIVASLAPLNREANIFQLVDAVAEGRANRAMRALGVLRAAGDTPQRIIAMIARQMRMIAVAREVLDRGGSQDDVEQELDVRSFVARRAVEQARRFNQAAADAALRRVLDCEVAIHNYRNDLPGGLRDDLALELLVADLAGASTATRPYSPARA